MGDLFDEDLDKLIDEDLDELIDEENENGELQGIVDVELDEDFEKESKSEEEGGKKSNQSIRNVRGQAVNFGVKTDVDIVMLIDVTGSMQPIIDNVKKTALSFHENIENALGLKKRVVNKMRIKVVAYRDYYYDWQDPDHPPIQESEFFTLPDDKDRFADFVNGLEAAGGEDEPESALEVLHRAFHNNWLNDPTITKSRQIIIVFTDASAHPLDDPMRYDSKFNSHYPEGIPTSLQELEDEYMDPDIFPVKGDKVAGPRLILFAPNVEPWNSIKNWNQATLNPMSLEMGCAELDMDEVYNLIGGSI